MTHIEIAKIWNDVKNSNETVAKLLGVESFEKAYTKVRRKPISELCTVVRTKAIDPSKTGTVSKEPKVKKEKVPKEGTTQAIETVGEPVLTLAVLEFRTPEGSTETRMLESEDKVEIFNAINDIANKYGNSKFVIKNKKTNVELKEANQITDGDKFVIVRIPGGGTR